MTTITSTSGRERGQTLILFAFGAIVLAAFVALAFDGGLYYVERRNAQNAADGASISGAYTLVRQKQAGSVNQSELQAALNRGAEDNGIVDTDGTPGNHINANVVAYFTDRNGLPIGASNNTSNLSNSNSLMNGGDDDDDEEMNWSNAFNPNDYCRVGSCSQAVADDAEGFLVFVQNPFDTMFAGVVGWRQMTTGAQAIALAHDAIPGDASQYAIFSVSQSCSGNTVHMTGSSVQINGNVHSNADILQSGSSTNVNGDISFVGECSNGCTATGSISQSRSRQLQLPSYEDYYDVAVAQIAAGHGTMINGNLNIRSRTPTLVGDPLRPFTLVNGNLTVFNQGNVTFYGLIVVTGEVRIQGRGVNQTHYSIVANGDVSITNTAVGFTGDPWQAPDDRYGPLMEDNIVKVFANSPGYHVCNHNSIKLSSSANTISGVWLAPHGDIEISGSSNAVNGSLIGQNVRVSGSSNTVSYNPLYAPPAPPRVELIR